MSAFEKSISITLTSDSSGERIDQVLSKQLPHYSRMQIKQWIENEHILINNKPVKASYKIKGGENVSITIIERQYSQWEPEAINLSIVYEDEEVLLINKPAGMVVHPGAGNSKSTLLNALLHHHPAQNTLPRAGIIHRIDKNTTGLLMVAKTQAAWHSLSKQLKDKTLLREYRTLVTGKLISGGKINAPIGRHPRERKKMAVVETGKSAITHYRVLAKFAGHTLLRVQLETGRTHQIRVHMAYIKHPVVGDPIYGGRLQLLKNASPTLQAMLKNFKRQALHAFALEFMHPITQQLLRFEAPLPDDMEDLIQAIKNG